METSAPTEFEAFNRYVQEHLGGTYSRHTLEEAVVKFRAYQRQLESLREKIRLSEKSASTDGTRPLTSDRLDGLCDQWASELRAEGKIE